ncbi:MAG: hypothetical protein L0H53_00775 [Candidatus Nitrosocosmicus sp.]|nr:hypothetical protein [Candidatus Nitrosocosmicus sp.]MDN5865951.1 hypothetical protein [Candidatus Nitrosocosmicus sp.]
MCSWLFNARKYNLDFQTKFTNLLNTFNSKVADDSADQGEDLQVSTEGDSSRSYIKFCDEDLASLKLISGVTPITASQLPFEPDFDTCKMFVEFHTLGAEVTDISGFGHTAKTVGINRLRKGIDYGSSRSIENVFDGRSCYAEVDNHSDIRISSITTGYTLFFRFLPFALDESGGFRQVVVCKKDIDDTDWWSFEIYEDGKASFNQKKANVIKSITTPVSTIAAVPYDQITDSTARYDVAVTYDHNTTTLKLFIDNVKYDTVSSSLPTGTQSPSATLNNNLNVGRYTDLVAPLAGEKYPARVDSKLYYGTFQQLKFFQDKVATDLEVGYHYTNKLTITDIPFGEVAAAGTMILDP